MKLGKQIAAGKTRIVYNHPSDNTLVIKKEHNNNTIYKCNEIEWFIWIALKDTKYKKYICPCVELSQCNNYLVMKKTSPSNIIPKLPTELRLRDVDKKNCGMFEERCVVIDYAHVKNLDIFNKIQIKENITCPKWIKQKITCIKILQEGKILKKKEIK